MERPKMITLPHEIDIRMKKGNEDYPSLDLMDMIDKEIGWTHHQFEMTENVLSLSYGSCLIAYHKVQVRAAINDPGFLVVSYQLAAYCKIGFLVAVDPEITGKEVCGGMQFQTMPPLNSN